MRGLSAVVKSLSCVPLCNPVNCSMPGFPHSLFPRVCSNLCPLSQLYYLTISFSAIPFSFVLQPFPASGSFPMSQPFTSDGQSIGASASVSVLPKNTALISRELSRVSFIRTLIPFMRSPPLQPNHLSKIPPPSIIRMCVNISTL